MNEEISQNANGVEIPKDIVEESRTKKAKRVKTLSQLPVCRDSVTLLDVVTELVVKSPASMRKFYDELTHAMFEIIISIGMADLSRNNPEQRVEYINCTIALVNAVKSAFSVLRWRNLLSKDADNKQKSLVKRINAQLVGWRDYTVSEGVELNEQPIKEAI